MTDTQRDRYSRQIRLAEIGLEGQERLRSASVVVIGAGGLGSPALHHLAGAGVGTVGVVEFDRVEVSNLHRQTLYSSHDVGDEKIDAAVARLRAVNPDVTVTPHRLKLDAANAASVLEGYDLVLDGSDTFSTRYVVNHASVQTGTPNVFASVGSFSGQASVFGTETGPCYRCLFPEPPPPGLIPNCDVGGVLGVVPSLMGTVQATEALKLILGIGTPLIGRLFLLDALDMTTREIAVERDPGCRTCGAGVRIEAEPPVLEIDAATLRARLAGDDPPVVLDVRTPDEHARGRISDLLIPLADLEARVGDLEDVGDRDVVVYCGSGVRSETAARLLARHGHRAWSLRGGIRAWGRPGA